MQHNNAWHIRTGIRTQANKAKAIIVPSPATKRDVIRFWDIPDEKIHVVEWGVTARKESIQNTNHRRTIFCLGTIEKRKNQKVLVEALAHMRRDPNFNDVKLRLVGDLGRGSDEVVRLAERLLPDDAFSIEGYVSENAKRDYFMEASVFVYPSLYEGAALPILEAMSMNVPVIATNRTAIPETVGDAALLLDPTRPLDIAEAIKQVFSDDLLRDGLVRRGAKRARKFTWNRAGEKVIAVLREVVGEKVNIF